MNYIEMVQTLRAAIAQIELVRDAVQDEDVKIDLSFDIRYLNETLDDILLIGSKILEK